MSRITNKCGFDDDFLQEHDYSKEEIQLGLQNLARIMGVESVVEALL